MAVTGILFDKDGTLLDFQATYGAACAGMIAEMAQGDDTLAIRLAEAVGFDRAANAFLDDSIIIAGTADDQADVWAPLLGVELDAGFAGRLDAMWARHSATTAALLDGAGEILSELAARGLRLGIATNDAEANARIHAGTAGIESLMDFVVGYDSGHGAKPGPGMVEAFARHCGCAPQAIVMIGDSVHDMAAARAAGAFGVGVTTGPATHGELAPHAVWVISGLHELAGLPFLAATESTA